MFEPLFFQVTLPLIITIVIATIVFVWPWNARPRQAARPLDYTNQRLDRLESSLQDVMKALAAADHRLTVLDERSSLVRG